MLTLRKLAGIIAIFVAFAAAKPTISHFTLINAESGSVIRRLSDGATVFVGFPFTIGAVPVVRPRIGIQFLSPLSHRQANQPYAIPGFRSSLFKAFTLFPQKLTISAFSDGDYENPLEISVTVRPKLSFFVPVKGPYPTRHHPVDPSKPFVQAPLAASSSKCSLKKPVVSDIKTSIEYTATGYNPRQAISFKLLYCRGSPVRIRLVSYPHPWLTDRSANTSSRVIASKITKNVTPIIFPPVTRCGTIAVYVEACVFSNKKGNLLCDTTELVALPLDQIEVPLLAFRPPIELHLAPGDRISVPIRTTFSKISRDRLYGFSSGSGNYYDSRYALQGVVKSEYGRLLLNTAVTLKRKILVEIPPKHWTNGISQKLFHNAQIQLLFAIIGKCQYKNLTPFASERFTTRLVVKPWIPSLITQDKQLPKIIGDIVYPPTQHLKPVTLTVNATNIYGGGRRAGGRKTSLYYQWYVRVETDRQFLSYAEPIIGATKSSITLKEARCDTQCAGRFGWNDRHVYYVDVCNTYGCIRSKPIIPNVLPPPLESGESWDYDYCHVQGEGYFCVDRSRYCVLDGLVTDCN